MEKLNESYEIIDNNIFVDFDKFKSGKNNVCLITGLSGSGKTTLATDLSYIHNATVVSLDHFDNVKKIGNELEKIDPVLYSYLSNRKELWEDLVNKKITGNKHAEEAEKYLDYAINYCKKDKYKKYIIEGIQIFWLLKGDDLKGCSLICLGTSNLKSMLQRLKRVNVKNSKLKDKLIGFLQNMIIYPDDDKAYKKFKNEVINSQEERPVNESYLFSKDNLYINFDKFESGKSNVCFITGLSGSGKSTLGESLSKKYKAEYIELDLFEHSYMFENEKQLKEAGEVFYEYLTRHRDIYEKLKTKKIQGKELGVEISKFFKYVLSYCRRNKNKKFIVEGVQIYAFGDPKIIKNYPIIFVQASVMKSIKQRWLRNGDGKIEWKEELKELPPMLKWYLDEEKSFKKFRRAITESTEVEPLEEVMVDNNPKYNEEDLTDHHGVGVVLLNEDMEILMLDHVKLNTEVFPVGKVKKGESVFEGMCNELFEETNLKINSAYEVVEFVLDIIRNGKKITQTNHIFICRDYSGNIKNKEPKKHRDVYFIPFEEMMKKNQNSYMVKVFKDAYRKGYIVLTQNTTNCMIDRQSSVDEMIYRTKFVKHVRKGNKYGKINK